MEVAAIIAIVVLAGVLNYVLRSREAERNDYLRAINLAVQTGDKERKRSLAIIADLTEKVQHPEIVHPRPIEDYTPLPEPELDPAFEQAGRIYPDEAA